MNLALLITTDDIGRLIVAFVGLVLVCAITYAIMRKVNAPEWMYRVGAIVGLVLLLLLVIAVFFGGGNVSVR